MANLVELAPSPQEGVLHVIVESPAGATAKIKWEPRWQVFALSRPLPLGVSYPHDWGFVPGTRAQDGDPLDALVLTEGTTYPGLLIPARPLGVLRLEQNRKGVPGRERNDRLIAIPLSAARQSLSHINEMSQRLRQEIEQFFRDVTFFESKDPTMLGWGGPEDAWALVQRFTQRAR
jgi:inorganic pyrophosphatase